MFPNLKVVDGGGGGILHNNRDGQTDGAPGPGLIQAGHDKTPGEEIVTEP